MQKLNYCARLVTIICLFSLMGACGQKGDLYLPENTVVDGGDRVN